MEGDEEERKEELDLAFSAIENLREFQLIFAHPEALVGNKNVIKLLNTAGFKNRIKGLWMKHISLLTGEFYLYIMWFICSLLFFIFYLSSFSFVFGSGNVC